MVKWYWVVHLLFSPLLLLFCVRFLSVTFYYFIMLKPRIRTFVAFGMGSKMNVVALSQIHNIIFKQQQKSRLTLRLSLGADHYINIATKYTHQFHNVWLKTSYYFNIKPLNIVNIEHVQTFSIKILIYSNIVQQSTLCRQSMIEVIS